MPAFDAARIRRYYDRHTAAFVAYGEGGDVGAIHRAVWAPGVEDRRQAFRYVEDRIADLVPSRGDSRERAHVVDLGCGVGGSLCYLAARLPIVATGLTLSPAQAALAGQRVAAAGLTNRVRCLEGDFLEPAASLAGADVAFAIEAFVHAPDAARFFAAAARVVRPGGALVICDDMRRPGGGRAADAARARFCRGWHLNSLLTADELRRTAEAAGFAHESTRDLTPFLELGRPRDRAIAALATAVGWLPWRVARLDPFLGGAALQTCLARGWVSYELAVFRRT